MIFAEHKNSISYFKVSRCLLFRIQFSGSLCTHDTTDFQQCRIAWHRFWKLCLLTRVIELVQVHIFLLKFSAFTVLALFEESLSTSPQGFWSSKDLVHGARIENGLLWNVWTSRREIALLGAVETVEQKVYDNFRTTLSLLYYETEDLLK